MKDVFFVSFLAGLAGNLLSYGWIGNFGAKVPGGYFVVLLFLIPSLSAFFSIKITAAEILSQKFPRLKIFIYPSIWIIIDYIQSIGFLAFPWTYIGYSQYPFTSFIQMASVTGILGVNFLMVMFNVVSSEYIRGFNNGFAGVRDIFKNSYFSRLALIVIFISAVTVSGYIRLIKNEDAGDGKKLKVALVQSCISPWEHWRKNKFKYLSELTYYTQEALKENPDFVIWSESATLELISYRAGKGDSDRFDRQLLEFVKENGKPLLTGEIGIIEKNENGKIKYYPQNNALLVSGEGEVVKSSPKLILVPFGEWFPYEKWFVPVKKLVESFGGSDFVPGSRPELFEIQGLKFGSLICYEGIFYRLCREYRNMGADFLVNITNDGWTDTFNGHYQHYAASIFRSVENGIWVVRAGNTGVTTIINPKGRAAKSIPILKKGYLTGEIDTSENLKTFYMKYGDLILIISFLLVFALAVKLGYNYLFEKRAKA
jgi:apolipoprotein N-acyltransferase